MNIQVYVRNVWRFTRYNYVDLDLIVNVSNVRVRLRRDNVRRFNGCLLVVIANYICYNNLMKTKAGAVIIDLLPSVVRDIYANMRSLAQPELTIFQFRVLKKLWVKPCTNNDLAAWAGINKATMSRALTTLQKRGLIERKTDEKDRRGNNIFLTQKGEKKIKAISQVVSSMISEKIEKIDILEQKQLLKGLTILKKVFNK